MDPRFDLLDETASALLKRDTLESVLTWAVETDEMLPLLEAMDEKGLTKLINLMIGDRDALDEALKRLPEEGPLEVWAVRLKEEQAAALNAILQKTEVKQAIVTLRESEPVDPTDIQAVNRQIFFNFLAIDKDDRLNNRHEFMATKGTGGKAGSWVGGKDELARVKKALATVRDPLKNDAVLKISLNEADKVLAGLLPVLRELFVVISRTYQQKKDQLDALDFDDLEKRAVELLESYPAVRNYWQNQVKALLVDEFQDTNQRQLRLVRLLCPDSGKLFIVGDAKQSIYRFRGADVTVFQGEEEQIKQAGGRSISLDTSYRAHEELLEGMNSLLKPVLGEVGSGHRPYEAPFERLNAGDKEVKTGVPHPHIEFQVALGNKEKAFPAAVRGLVGRLQEIVTNSELDWGDIAILCRSSGAFATYEDVLDEANIPYLTLSGRGFLDRPEIRDLLNALQAINDPHDNLALVGLLRSPACGLSDIDLFHLLSERSAEQSLWDVVQTEIFWPDAVDKVKLRAIYQLINQLNQQVGRKPAADIFKAFLDQTNYRVMLRSAGMSRSLRNISKLLADIHESELISLSGFLEYLAEMKDSGTRTGEARSTAKGAVQLMTIHASKGLEFPVVVLGDAGNTGNKTSKILSYPQLWIMFPGKLSGKRYVNLKETESGAVLLAKVLEKAQEDAERKRLLYVALTRAEQMLIINGNTKLSSKGALSGTSWLNQLGEICELKEELPAEYDDNGGQIHELGCVIRDLDIGGRCVEPNMALSPMEFDDLYMEVADLQAVNPQMIESYAQPTKELTEKEIERPNRVWQVVPTAQRPTAPAWVVGQIVHEALAQWRFPADEQADDDLFDRWAAARGQEYGLTNGNQLHHGVNRAKKLLSSFRHSPIFAEIKTADQRFHELPYVLDADEGIIDLLIEQNGVWTIIDFKTDQIQDADNQKRAVEGYTTQLERYKTAVERLVGARPQVKLVLLNGADGVVTVGL